VSEVAKGIFKIIGGLLFVYMAVNLVVFNFWILVCIPCWPIFSLLIILSIGMFYLRKWAAVGISLLCCFFAFLFFGPSTDPGAASALRHTDGLLLRLALARLTFSRISLAFAVQINGLGWRLCS